VLAGADNTDGGGVHACGNGFLPIMTMIAVKHNPRMPVGKWGRTLAIFRKGVTSSI
jgi:hypothetical protein